MSKRLDKNIEKQEVTMPGIVNVTIQPDQTLKTNVEGLEDDSFWGEENQARLKDSLQELIDGKIVAKTSKELEAMENE